MLCESSPESGILFSRLLLTPFCFAAIRYDCGSQQLDCSFSFDAPKRMLTLDKTWQCSDKNAAQP